MVRYTGRRKTLTGTSTNQTGLKLSGNGRSIGARTRYTKKRAVDNVKVCGPIYRYGKIWGFNTKQNSVCVPPSTTCATAGGVGRKNVPRLSCSKSDGVSNNIDPVERGWDVLTGIDYQQIPIINQPPVTSDVKSFKVNHGSDDTVQCATNGEYNYLYTNLIIQNPDSEYVPSWYKEQVEAQTGVDWVDAINIIETDSTIAYDNGTILIRDSRMPTISSIALLKTNFENNDIAQEEFMVEKEKIYKIIEDIGKDYSDLNEWPVFTYSDPFISINDESSIYIRLPAGENYFSEWDNQYRTVYKNKEKVAVFGENTDIERNTQYIFELKQQSRNTFIYTYNGSTSGDLVEMASVDQPFAWPLARRRDSSASNQSECRNSFGGAFATFNVKALSGLAKIRFRFNIKPESGLDQLQWTTPEFEFGNIDGNDNNEYQQIKFWIPNDRYYINRLSSVVRSPLASDAVLAAAADLKIGSITMLGGGSSDFTFEMKDFKYVRMGRRFAPEITISEPFVVNLEATKINNDKDIVQPALSEANNNAFNELMRSRLQAVTESEDGFPLFFDWRTPEGDSFLGPSSGGKLFYNKEGIDYSYRTSTIYALGTDSTFNPNWSSWSTIRLRVEDTQPPLWQGVGVVKPSDFTLTYYAENSSTASYNEIETALNDGSLVPPVFFARDQCEYVDNVLGDKYLYQATRQTPSDISDKSVWEIPYTATDYAGNTSEPNFLTIEVVEVDTAGPNWSVPISKTITLDENDLNVDGSLSIEIRNTNTILMNWLNSFIPSDSSGIASATCNLGDPLNTLTNITATWNTGTGAWSIGTGETYGPQTPVDQQTFLVLAPQVFTAVDNNGNSSSITTNLPTFTWRYAITPPAVVTWTNVDNLTNVEPTSDKGIRKKGLTWVNNSLRHDTTISTWLQNISVSIDKNGIVTTPSLSYQYQDSTETTVSIDLNDVSDVIYFPPGNTTITVSFEDDDANEEDKTRNVILTVNQPPSIPTLNSSGSSINLINTNNYPFNQSGQVNIINQAADILNSILLKNNINSKYSIKIYFENEGDNETLASASASTREIWVNTYFYEGSYADRNTNMGNNEFGSVNAYVPIMVHEVLHVLNLVGISSRGGNFADYSVDAYRGLYNWNGENVQTNCLLGYKRLLKAKAQAQGKTINTENKVWVLMENGGGSGTRMSHFEESKNGDGNPINGVTYPYLNNELMTGYFGGSNEYFTSMSVGALEDVGFVVNYDSKWCVDDEISLQSWSDFTTGVNMLSGSNHGFSCRCSTDKDGLHKIYPTENLVCKPCTSNKSKITNDDRKTEYLNKQYGMMNIKNENVIIKPKVTVGKKKSRGKFLKKFTRMRF